MRLGNIGEHLEYLGNHNYFCHKTIQGLSGTNPKCLLDDKSNENLISLILMRGTLMPSHLYANYYALVIWLLKISAPQEPPITSDSSQRSASYVTPSPQTKFLHIKSKRKRGFGGQSVKARQQWESQDLEEMWKDWEALSRGREAESDGSRQEAWSKGWLVYIPHVRTVIPNTQV